MEMRKSNGDDVPSKRARIAAPPEVDIATAARLSEAIDAALVRQPLELLLDFGGTTFFASDGAYVLANAAAACHDRRVTLEVIESEAVTKLFTLVGLHGPPDWLQFARRLAVGRPHRIDAATFAGLAREMIDEELVATVEVCWGECGAATTPTARLAAQHRVTIALAEQFQRAGIQPPRRRDIANASAG
jgi:anti-anti-sigma regulatory factor